MFFIIAGIMAELMRTELARPGLQFLTPEQYNQLFTMHGTLMLLMFATPLFVGFANEIMPLQIGSPDVAFPRLNMLSYWFFLFGSLIVLGGALTPGGWADFGWYAYSPLTEKYIAPSRNGRSFRISATRGHPAVPPSIRVESRRLRLRICGRLDTEPVRPHHCVGELRLVAKPG